MSWSSSNRRSQLPADWQSRRLARFAIDGWSCVDCGHHSPTGAGLECDHIGDRHDHSLDQLRTRCRPCHQRRTQAQARAERRTQARPAEPHPGLTGGATPPPGRPLTSETWR